MTDIVIPLGSASDWGNHNELRYCLRSIETYAIGLGNIWIIGHKPDWLINCNHIDYPDIYIANKDANIIEKVMAACAQYELSCNFIRMSDDQVFINPVSLSDTQPHHAGLIQHKLENRKQKSRWVKRLQRTFDYLKQHNIDAYNFDYHLPQPYNKYQFRKIIQAVDYSSGIGYCINTLYLNLLIAKCPFLYGSINRAENIKATIERAYSLDKINYICNGKSFLGYNDAGLNCELISYLQNKFPKKSKYESD